jgi:hypothetical protein
VFKKSIKLPIGLGTGPIWNMCPYWPKSARLEAILRKKFSRNFSGGPGYMANSRKNFPKIFQAVRVIWLVPEKIFQKFFGGPGFKMSLFKNFF